MLATLAIFVVILLLVIYFFWRRLPGPSPRRVHMSAMYEDPRAKGRAELMRRQAEIAAEDLREIQEWGRRRDTLYRMPDDVMAFALDAPYRFADLGLGLEDDIGAAMFAADTARAMANSLRFGSLEGAPVERTQGAFEEAGRVRNDGQNVHDSHFNEDLRRTIARLEHTKGAGTPTDWVDLRRRVPPSLAGAFDATAMRMVNEPTYVSTYDKTDTDLVDLVWRRSSTDPDEIRRENLRDSLALMVADCASDGGGIVCANGRCARIVSSMAGIDRDESMGAAMTGDMARSDAFARVGEAIDRWMESANNDPKLGPIAKMWADPDYVPDEGSPEILQFRVQMDGAINDAVGEIGLSPADRDRVLQDSLAAVRA